MKNSKDNYFHKKTKAETEYANNVPEDVMYHKLFI